MSVPVTSNWYGTGACLTCNKVNCSEESPACSIGGVVVKVGRVVRVWCLCVMR